MVDGEAKLTRRKTRGAGRKAAQKINKQHAKGGRANLQAKIQSRIERLESTNATDPLHGEGSHSRDDMDDDEYNSDDSEIGKRKKKKKRGRPTKKQKKKAATIFKRNTLVSILLNESSDPDYLSKPNFFSIAAEPTKYPPRKICVVSGNVAPYKDQTTGLYYSDLKALETLREHPPAWFSANGHAPFSEAKQIVKQSTKNLHKKRPYGEF